MMIPTEVILLPLYRLIVKMGLINNMWGIILPYLVVPCLLYTSWEAYGLEVAGFAHDGETAFQMCQELLPSFLITDIRMPGLNLSLIHISDWEQVFRLSLMMKLIPEQ